MTTYSSLDRPVQFLKGVGPRRAELLRKLGLLTARDLLYHVPRRYEDASTVQPIRTLEPGMDATVVGRIVSKGVLPTRKGLRIFQAVLRDRSGLIETPHGCGNSLMVRATALPGPAPFLTRSLVHVSENWNCRNTHATRVLGYVPQDDNIHTDLPLRRTLRYAARLRLPALQPSLPRTAAGRRRLTR